MIAAGLCMMGGCFAQETDGKSVDSYWPAEHILMPRIASSASVDVFGYRNTDIKAKIGDCVAFMHMEAIDSAPAAVAFFIVEQASRRVYASYFQNPVLKIDYWTPNGNKNFYTGGFPQPVDFFFQLEGGIVRFLGTSIALDNGSNWDSSLPVSRLTILDRRNSDQVFHVAYGRWGYKWYLLPMKSPSLNIAVFDVETDTLVEI